MSASQFKPQKIVTQQGKEGSPEWTHAACSEETPVTRATGQLQWNSLEGSNLLQNVSGKRWASGALISKNFFLTAGHCFDTSADPKGWVTPQRPCGDHYHQLTPYQMAPLMKINFGYEVPFCPLLDNFTTPEYAQYAAMNETSFPIVKLWEHRKGSLDYAIVELGKNAEGESAGDKFGYAELSFPRYKDQSIPIYVAHHANGNPKLVSKGWNVDANSKHTYYFLDTDPGASGGPQALQRDDTVGAVHISSVPDADLNRGVTVQAIAKVSPFINNLTREPFYAAPSPATLMTGEWRKRNPIRVSPRMLTERDDSALRDSIDMTSFMPRKGR